MKKNESRTKEVFVRWHIDAVRSGLTAELGPQRFLVLLTIAAHMNKDAECWPSQETLAKELGWSVQNTNKWVNSLLDFRWFEKAIITRKKVYKGYKPYSVYTIHPLSQIAIYETKVDPIAFKTKLDESTSTNDEVVDTVMVKVSEITESKWGDKLNKGTSTNVDVGTPTSVDVATSTEVECNNKSFNNKPDNNKSSSKKIIAFGEATPQRGIDLTVNEKKKLQAESYKTVKEKRKIQEESNESSAAEGTPSNDEIWIDDEFEAFLQGR